MNTEVQSDSGAVADKANSASIKALDANIMSVFEHQRLRSHDFLYQSDFEWLITQELSVFSIKRKQRQWQLKVGHYIGVIVLPSGMTLEILPKIIANSGSNQIQQSNKSLQDSEVLQSRDWVQNMLSDLMNTSEGKSPHNKNFGQFTDKLAALPLAALPLSNWLLAQFLQRLVYYQPTKNYQAQTQNQATLQGRLLIKEQLRHNNMQPHKFVCEISVLGQDMLSNRLIKSALVLLAPLLPTSTLPKSLLLWQQVRALNQHELSRIESLYQQAKQQLTVQPLARQQLQAAQQLLELAYWLLRQSNTHSGNGIEARTPANNSQIQSRLCLLIDMNQAFEQWASQRIAAAFQQRDLGYKPLFQSQSVWLNDAEGQACLSIRPDLLIYQNTYPNHERKQSHSDKNAYSLASNLGYSRRYSHVIDIKWKHLASSAAISASDAYQLTSYAQAYQADQVWLVYPVAENNRKPVVLSQKIHNDKNAEANIKKDANSNLNNNTNHAQLWLIPFNVLSGTINSDLLPSGDVV